MWAGVTDDFLTAIRFPHRRESTAEYRDPITGDTTLLEIEDGSVTDDATSRVRRSLSLSVPNRQSTWDLLASPGGEITVRQTLVFPNGTRFPVPMGVFVVDKDTLGYGPEDTITMTCPDRWVRIQRNGFTTSRSSVPGNHAWQEIRRLFEGAWPGATYPFPGWSELDTTAYAQVGVQVWDDGSRETAIADIADANSVEVFFDRGGGGIMRPIPVLTNTSPRVWTIDAGTTGVMLAASRDRDRGSFRNTIVVSSSATDIYFDPVVVQNTTPSDPLSIYGPLGAVTEDYTSPSIRSSAQASIAGRTRLAVTMGVAQQVSVSTYGNPALDARDVIMLRFPAIDPSTVGTKELHIIDTISHPLMPDGTQEIRTRSTRPDTDVTG